MTPTIPEIEELELDKNIGNNGERKAMAMTNDEFARLLVSKGYVFGYDEDTALQRVIELSRTTNRYTYLAENGSILLDAVRYNGLWYGVTDISKAWRKKEMDKYNKKQEIARNAMAARLEKMKQST